MTRRQDKNAADDGFTLLELLVVLGIIALLAGLAVPSVLQYLSSAREKTAITQMRQLASSVELFALEAGRYPTEEEGLKALIAQPPAAAIWNGPYLNAKQIPLDPWGNQYLYRQPGDDRAFDVITLGADGVEGGEDENKDLIH